MKGLQADKMNFLKRLKTQEEATQKLSKKLMADAKAVMEKASEVMQKTEEW